MRKRLIKLLYSPESGNNSFKVFALELKRKEEVFKNISHNHMADDDDIVTGVMVSESAGVAYPIINSVLVMLNDNDMLVSKQFKLFDVVYDSCPEEYKSIIREHKNRIEEMRKTDLDRWNNDEMIYFDKKVDTQELRDSMIKDIKNTQLWRIFIPRKQQIIHYLKPNCELENILEIGCGNARTLSWIFPPLQYKYNYIGLDISFKRLLVAKAIIPQGDFIQASAVKIPFQNDSLFSIISFGTLHHLPNPEKAVDSCVEKIQNGGLFALHEPMKKPKFINRDSKLYKRLNTYEHSSHDDEVDSEVIVSRLNESGFKPINLKFYNSALKTLLEKILSIFPEKFGNNKIMVRIVHFFDVIFLKTIGRISKRFGPHAIIGIFKKEKEIK
jgi:SAM-dependent methyltransferase/uncharacterized protein YbaR (Trm112 family)